MYSLAHIPYLKKNIFSKFKTYNHGKPYRITMQDIREMEILISNLQKNYCTF